MEIEHFALFLGGFGAPEAPKCSTAPPGGRQGSQGTWGPRAVDLPRFGVGQPDQGSGRGTHAIYDIYR